MNTIKRLGMASALMLAVASSSIAGNIHTGVVTPPPPPEEQQATGDPQTATAPGKIQIGLIPDNITTELIVNLLLSVY